VPGVSAISLRVTSKRSCGGPKHYGGIESGEETDGEEIEPLVRVAGAGARVLCVPAVDSCVRRLQSARGLAALAPLQVRESARAIGTARDLASVKSLIDILVRTPFCARCMSKWSSPIVVCFRSKRCLEVE
jgi:hypothetical protein